MIDAWQPVVSSTIDAVAYDGTSRTMKVRFKGGRIYVYHDVPPDVPEGVLTASSAGEAFHATVVGQYRHTRG